MVYLCYSAAAVDYSYCVGMLSAKEGADLLDADQWTKHPVPLLSTDDLVNQCGPGHNSFTTDENGNPVIVYHARPILECSSGGDWNGTRGQCQYIKPGENSLIDPCRHARIKAVNFAADGSPILNMTAEEELRNEYQTIKATVVVQQEQAGDPPVNPPSNPSVNPPDQPSVTPPANSSANKKTAKKIELSKEKFVYDGKVKTSKITVKEENGTKIPSANYTVSFTKGRKQPGVYQATVTMKGEYEGTLSKQFQILPPKVVLKKAVRQKNNSAKLLWKKCKAGISGYEIQYSVNSKFKKKAVKSKTVSKKKTTYVLKKIKAKKKYYVRIRAYKSVKVNKKTVRLYSAWSKKTLK